MFHIFDETPFLIRLSKLFITQIGNLLPSGYALRTQRSHPNPKP